MVERQTKIIATIGPASNNHDTLTKMALNGMNIVRLNFSHGDLDSKLHDIELIKQINEENDLNLAIMLDTKGPEIRLGEIENKSIDFEKGDILRFTKENVIGNKQRIHIACPEVFDDVKENDIILINDGKMQATILENNGQELLCRIDVSGPISSRKGCNVPGVKLSMPFISQKDEEDIRFGCRNDVDFISASFVRRADDVRQIREIIKSEGKSKIKIIAKIENQEGFDNLSEILEVSDGIMVARGDLGVEIRPDRVPIYQKDIIRMCNMAGKPVITATHMLDSMTTNPRCTRAEASDVANAVLDGTDAVMLSAETASGLYPVESVLTMASLAKSAEDIFPYRARHEEMSLHAKDSIQDAIGIAIADATFTLPVCAIVVFTQGGNTARIISKYRPLCPIYAVTFDKQVQRSLENQRGVTPIYSKIQNNMHNDDELASAICKSYGHLPGDLVIISAGYPTGEGSANMMKIINIK